MRRIGLALGGGGARGFAHLGVFRALAELQVPIHCVAGTSIGAIMGGIFAARSTERADAWAHASDWEKLPKLFLEPHFPKRSLMRGDKIEAYLREMLPITSFEECQIPFCATATDLHTGEEVQLDSGDIVSAIRASMSIPGIFDPVLRDGRVLIDGGFSNQIPSDICHRMGADVVIGVDINAVCGVNEAERKSYEDLNIIDVLAETLHICDAASTKRSFDKCRPDVLICPPVAERQVMDFRNVAPLIDIGYRAAMDHRDEIFALMGVA